MDGLREERGVREHLAEIRKREEDNERHFINQKQKVCLLTVKKQGTSKSP